MIGKIKSLRGIFYRKIADAVKTQEPIAEVLPGFVIKKSQMLVEFPEITDITKVNITYPIIEPFVYVNIKWDPEKKELMYIVIEPKMTEEEMKLLQKIASGLIELVDVELSSIRESHKIIKYLEENVTKILKEYGISLTQSQYVKIMYFLYRNFVGFNEIDSFLQDPNIEDISCDGVNTPIYIIHRKFGSLKTNIGFADVDDLREFVVKLAERCGRYVSYAEPILDGTLPDGSRISATLAGDVATRGPTFTIRKFTEKPISPIEQIDLKTVSPEVMAYFWYLMEHGASILISGGVATGKTSFLNSLCMFIPPEAKIVSIEDTRELRIPNEHWIPSLARVGFGIPMPTGEKYGEVTLFDLLKESFRQNPDYVIVGEVRGAEAYVMFQGMSSGHPCLSTFHAGSVDTIIKRLITPPIELPPSLIESLDVITIMVHAKEKGKSARRISEVVEIESVDPKTDEVKTNVVFKWNPVTDEFEKVNESIKVKKIMATKGGKLEDALAEIESRRKILERFYEMGIKDFMEITKLINLYYKEPMKLFDKIGKVAEVPLKVSVPTRISMSAGISMPTKIGIMQAKPEISKAKPRERASILDLLGLKMIREK